MAESVLDDAKNSTLPQARASAKTVADGFYSSTARQAYGGDSSRVRGSQGFSSSPGGDVGSQATKPGGKMAAAGSSVLRSHSQLLNQRLAQKQKSGMGGVPHMPSEAVLNAISRKGDTQLAPLHHPPLHSSLESKSLLQNASIYDTNVLNDKKVTLDEYLQAQLKNEENQDPVERQERLSRIDADGHALSRRLGQVADLVQTLDPDRAPQRKIILKEGAKTYKHAGRQVNHRKVNDRAPQDTLDSSGRAFYSDMHFQQNRGNVGADRKDGRESQQKESTPPRGTPGMSGGGQAARVGEQQARAGASPDSQTWSNPQNQKGQQRLGSTLAGARGDKQALNLPDEAGGARPQTQMKSHVLGSGTLHQGDMIGG